MTYTLKVEEVVREMEKAYARALKRLEEGPPFEPRPRNSMKTSSGWWSDPDRPHCIAMTPSGKWCRSAPMKGTWVCKMHGGSTERVKNKARERLTLAADQTAYRMIQMIEDPEIPPNVRLQAMRDLLDRAGLGATQQIEVDVKRYEQLIGAGSVAIDLAPTKELEQVQPDPEDVQRQLDELI